MDRADYRTGRQYAKDLLDDAGYNLSRRWRTVIRFVLRSVMFLFAALISIAFVSADGEFNASVAFGLVFAVLLAIYEKLANLARFGAVVARTLRDIATKLDAP